MGRSACNIASNGWRNDQEEREDVRLLLRFGAALTLLVLSGAEALAQPAEPDPECSYYAETSHNLCAPFEQYWGNNGGLPVFGYPITEAADEFITDRQDSYLTQYFERERMEYHPALAGSPYEILLGRLGNDVLLEMGRDWFTFPAGDPAADHYFAETGHAIGAEFWDYWSSHGLDLGDEGVSFAESLALFGYPLSEPALETNSSNDTVLTQWFERARFEYHPDNPAGSQVLLGLLGNELLALRGGGGEPEPPAGEAIVTGLNNPRGIFAAADGTIYAIDSGIPTENCFMSPPPDGGDSVDTCYGYTSRVIAIDPAGVATTVVSGLPEVNAGGEGGTVQDIVVDADGSIYGIIGYGGDPADRFQTFGEFGNDLGWVFVSSGNGGWEKIVDISAYEGLENPGGEDPEMGGVDSNPYSLTMDGALGWVVADAGGNDLLHVDAEGTVSTLAVFPPQFVPAPPFLGLPDSAVVPMQAVPTGVVRGPDGAFYVGELTGFPFDVGSARVWRVTADGQATVYAEGFTNVLDIAFDGAGNLYVLEGVAGGLLNADPSDPASAAAQIVMVAPDGTQADVPSGGLVFATGMAIGHDGTIYVSNFGVMPGMGQIVAIDGVATPIPDSPELTVVVNDLENPRGLYVDDNGDLYVTQGGTAGEVCQDAPGTEGDDPIEICFGTTGTVELISDAGQFSAVTGISSLRDIRGDIVGAQDVAIGDDGLIYTTVGLGADPADRDHFPVEGGDLGWIVSASAGASSLLAVDISTYEALHNPDGGLLDSNPYSLTSDGEGGWVVSDAGMNALLHVDELGSVSQLAVFASRLVVAPPEAGLPEGTQVPMQAVPTGVVRGPDGAFYVGELTGFPFIQGAARVWRVTADGQATVYAEGFTNIVDLAFDSAGNLFVLELAKHSLLSEDVTSAVVQVMEDGGQVEVASTGLTFATGMAIGPDDTFYVSNFGVMPGLGQVVSFSLS